VLSDVGTTYEVTAHKVTHIIAESVEEEPAESESSVNIQNASGLSQKMKQNSSSEPTYLVTQLYSRFKGKYGSFFNPDQYNKLSRFNSRET
jgi:hypothetical protein